MQVSDTPNRVLFALSQREVMKWADSRKLLHVNSHLRRMLAPEGTIGKALITDVAAKTALLDNLPRLAGKDHSWLLNNQDALGVYNSAAMNHHHFVIRSLYLGTAHSGVVLPRECNTKEQHLDIVSQIWKYQSDNIDALNIGVRDRSEYSFRLAESVLQSDVTPHASSVALEVYDETSTSSASLLNTEIIAMLCDAGAKYPRETLTSFQLIVEADLAIEDDDKEDDDGDEKEDDDGEETEDEDMEKENEKQKKKRLEKEKKQEEKEARKQEKERRKKAAAAAKQRHDAGESGTMGKLYQAWVSNPEDLVQFMVRTRWGVDTHEITHLFYELCKAMSLGKFRRLRDVSVPGPTSDTAYSTFCTMGIETVYNKVGALVGAEKPTKDRRVIALNAFISELGSMLCVSSPVVEAKLRATMGVDQDTPSVKFAKKLFALDQDELTKCVYVMYKELVSPPMSVRESLEIISAVHGTPTLRTFNVKGILNDNLLPLDHELLQTRIIQSPFTGLNDAPPYYKVSPENPSRDLERYMRVQFVAGSIRDGFADHVIIDWPINFVLGINELLLVAAYFCRPPGITIAGRMVNADPTDVLRMRAAYNGVENPVVPLHSQLAVSFGDCFITPPVIEHKQFEERDGTRTEIVTVSRRGVAVALNPEFWAKHDVNKHIANALQRQFEHDARMRSMY